MSLTLRAAARSAYRDLLRASASTFAGKLTSFTALLFPDISPGDAPIQQGHLFARRGSTI